MSYPIYKDTRFTKFFNNNFENDSRLAMGEFPGGLKTGEKSKSGCVTVKTKRRCNASPVFLIPWKSSPFIDNENDP
jgi:hypothetical protein